MTGLSPLSIRSALIRLCGLLLVLLSACAAPAGADTRPAPTAPTPSPQNTATETATKIESTPTPSLPPEFTSQFTGTGYSLDGSSITYTSETGEKLTLPGTLDATGFHLDLGNGKVINVSADQLADRMKIGQGNMGNFLAIYDETGKAIDYGYDKKDNVWLKISMVSTELNTPEDFANLPVLDDKADFDSGKVQQVGYWLTDNVLPPADIELPDSWGIGGEPKIGFLIMDWDHITEPNIKPYRFVDAFFVIHDGVKMLRVGLEFGGTGQLLYLNFENSSLWNDPSRANALIAALNYNNSELLLVDSYGSLSGSVGPYTQKVTSERLVDGDQIIKYWIENRKLPEGADITVFGAVI